MSDNSRDYEFDPELLSIRKFVRNAEGKMVLEFDQFSAEAASATSGYVSAVTTDNALIVSAITGKYFHTRYVIVANPTATATSVLFHDGNTALTKFSVRVGTAATQNITGLNGPVFTGAIYVSFSSTWTGIGVLIGGIRNPLA